MIRPDSSEGKSLTPTSRSLVVRNLEHAREWLDKRLGKPSAVGDPWEAENILIGCLNLMGQAGRRSLGQWLDRRAGRRRALRRIRESYNTKVGHRALSGLIDLVVSDLEACTWQTDFLIDPLPVKVQAQRPRTEAHKQKLKESAARTRCRRKEAQEARFAEERSNQRERAQKHA